MKRIRLGTFVSAVLIAGRLLAAEVEVLHWWTSGGEARSAALLEELIQQKGHHWKNFAVAGGGGEGAMMVLKSRAVSGTPPTAAQIKGDDIQEWARLGFLTNLDELNIPSLGMWNRVLPFLVAKRMKYEGRYVAVPVNIHRVNWLWINRSIFEKVGIAVPTTLDEFFTAMRAIQAAGYIPLAHGDEPWQNAMLFENIALAVLGSEKYQKAFVDLDMATLSSKDMTEVFRRFKQLHGYVDQHAAGRDWNAATEMLIKGEAAMQIMGDWAKGELTAAGKVVGRDFLCVPAPGTAEQFSYNVDSMVFFKSDDAEERRGQSDLASAIISKPFQKAFNASKGSIPTRVDVSAKGFDPCSRDAMNAFHSAARNDNLLPSLSQGMATTSFIQSVIFEVINEFITDPAADPKLAPWRLARAIKAAK